MATRILLVLLVLVGTASAQQAPQKLTVGIYAPSVEFGTSQARLAYVQGLAKSIEQATRITTHAQAYASIGALKKDAASGNLDFAIVDGLCYATNMGWNLLANARIGDSTTRLWALYSSAGDSMQSLRGKKLAYIQASCNDNGFIEHAMLETEVDSKFFGQKVSANDLTGAIASVASYKTAQAVFAPVGSAKGLTKVFDTAQVPNPAFVEVNSKLPNTITTKVQAAVVGYGGGGAISGWSRAARDVYSALAFRLQPVRKGGLFASPDPVRINASAVLIEPTTLDDTAFIAVRHHFVRPAAGRME